MKKILVLVFLLAAFGVKAQDYARQFDVNKYADQLTQDIFELTGIQDEAMQQKIEIKVYNYARSIRKHLILFEQEGNLKGKTLEEAIASVKSEADNATKFSFYLKRWLNEDQYAKLVEAGIVSK